MRKYRLKINRATLIGIIGLLLLAAVIVKGPGYVRNTFFDQFTERNNEPVLALFKHGDSTATRLTGMPHYTLYWKSTAIKFKNSGELLRLLKKSDVLLSIETWPQAYAGPWYTDALTAILKGSFNRQLDELAGLIKQSSHSIYVRFDPDMEVPVYQFPWQYQSAPQYIRAFNYMAAKLKQAAPAAKIIWGPSGFPGDSEFWPGNKYVDLISVTLGSQSEQTSSAYPYQPQLPGMLFSKLHRLRFMDKPVLVLGGQASAASPLQPDWLKQQVRQERRYDTTVYSPANFITTDPDKPVRQKLKVGVFDPNRRLINNPNVSIEHIFTDMGEIERGELKLRFDSILARHHDVVLTVEPWKDTIKRPDPNVLQSTLDGRFDPAIQKLYQLISNCGQTVYLRFAHEMEIPIKRYAWQSKDPATYIRAFRYFMQADKIHAKNIKRVWGPAGDRGSADWWPGSDVVDYISIAIYGLPDKNITDPNKQELFSTIFQRKYYRMRFLNRPLFITEFGVKGPEDYQHKWLADAANTLRHNKHVFGICYFNLYDNPKTWGHIKAPDWSISPQNMQFFCNSVNAGN
ncbi:hypothetical protein HQ865_06260 [Mucilaginibacter mali]|uniref:GH26 domain-containing protein n=1 Tax=Mucilaginibacter mali TaxID=2740462 RepID=A0A7D4TTV0_9SPHI|nr:hypothetical protein [Mucilaginibacter mali]QKJ29375.1 hypothetical protein HQ865_06260 [Mucilaginibacter mali]